MKLNRKTLRGIAKTVKPAVGQVWAENNKSRGYRRVKVVGVDEFFGLVKITSIDGKRRMTNVNMARFAAGEYLPMPNCETAEITEEA